jgi:hypothetical protein
MLAGELLGLSILGKILDDRCGGVPVEALRRR